MFSSSAEMWFGIVFAVLVEIVPFQVRSTTVGIFLFVMNNIGGNLPILVDPVAKYLGYREALMIFYAGFYFLSEYFIQTSSKKNIIFQMSLTHQFCTISGSILFFITIFVMEPKTDVTENEPPKVMYDNGHDNKVFVGDRLPQPQFQNPPNQTNGTTNAYYPNVIAQTNNVNHSNDNMQQSYRVIENSRL